MKTIVSSDDHQTDVETDRLVEHGYAYLRTNPQRRVTYVRSTCLKALVQVSSLPNCNLIEAPPIRSLLILCSKACADVDKVEYQSDIGSR